MTTHQNDAALSPPAEPEPVVLHERRGAVVYLTLNRPHSLNAINRELGNLLLDLLRECEVDETVRAIVLQGSGRAFCAGDDIRGPAPGSPPRPRIDPALNSRYTPYYALQKALRLLPKPVIARVHGLALGAGCDLVLASDIAIAAESARLGLVFIRRAIHGGTYFVTKHVGLKKATELLFTGDMIEAAEALRLGLITRCVPDDQLDAAVAEWAERMASGPTRVLGYMKTALNMSLSVDIERGMDFASYMQIFAGMTEDRVEGRQSFVEKRAPMYTGR